MNLYEHCLQLTDVTPQNEKIKHQTSLPASKTVHFTFPKDLLSDVTSIKSICNGVYYISDIHLVHKIANKFNRQSTNDQIKSYISKIAADLISQITLDEAIFFGGDISSCFEISELFYTEFVFQWKKKFSYYSNLHSPYIYVILGNHEFWDYETIDACYTAYKFLSDKLGIHFLQNTITWLGKHKTPVKEIKDIDGQTQLVELKKSENQAEFELQSRYIHNTMIVGGVGFSGYNNEFNADMGIYNKALTREREVQETLKWEETYKHALKLAKDNNCVLIVLTHNPISDWKADGLGDAGCIYFSGHTHQDFLYHDEEKNIHIFANNQIGYHNPNVKFKHAFLYNRANPFAGYEDGYYEISGIQYLNFYDYMLERIRGIGFIERQMHSNNVKFYMIKHNGYYGFFLVSSRGTFICVGGRSKKISECSDIKQFDAKFLQMVRQYIKLLSPYRDAQEQISQAVKSFGGNGTIHGCIIDIDAVNHIMLDPFDGSVIYYYSPSFGLIKKYENLMELLDNHNKQLAAQYRNQLQDRNQDSVLRIQTNITNETIQIDIKNSIYSFSNKLSHLQRLFEKKILRDWNEHLI